MYISYKKLLFIFCILFILFIMFLLIKDYQYKHMKLEEKPYTNFVTLVKSGAYLEAYKNLYPLILKNDPQAMRLIGDAYSEEYGVNIDLVKARMWYLKSKNMGRDGGELEYKQAMFFLKMKDYGMASEFLQKSAELGYRGAIEKIKNQEFMELNNLNVNPNWKMYWMNFNYQDLYPYHKEIE